MDTNTSPMHKFESESKNPFFAKLLMLFVIVALLGVGTGFILAKIAPNLIQESALPSPNGKSSVEKGKVYGSNDTSTFKDMAEGTLKEGGMEGEGQFHLVRQGGESQNVYLTSSLVDLSLFVDKKIKVWGQTQAAQKAGWLMDVGRVEAL